MALVQMDAAWFHVPIVLVALGLLAMDEAMVRRLRQRARGKLWSWLWVVAVGLAGLGAQLAIVVLLLLPMFKMAS